MSTTVHPERALLDTSVLTGGDLDGATVSPAVVAGVSASASLSQDELFGDGFE